MDLSSCKREHAWPNTATAMWDVNKESLTDPMCRNTHSSFYNSDSHTPQNRPKPSSGRAPQGVEQVSGRVSPYDSSSAGVSLTRSRSRSRKQPQTHDSSITRTKVPRCSTVFQESVEPPECKDIVLPNPNTRRSFEPWLPAPTRPCYRKKYRRGVTVGIQDMPDTEPIDDDTLRPWDNDTWIPPGGIFMKFSELPM